MELKTLLLPEKVVSFDFPGCDGFVVDLVFLSKESNQTLYKKCQTTKFDRKTRLTTEKFDEDLFLELYVEAIIKGWKGFKADYLSDLVLSEIPENLKGTEINYSSPNALELMKSSTIFDGWVSEVIADLGNFTSNNITKNLTESKDTSKSPDQD